LTAHCFNLLWRARNKPLLTKTQICQFKLLRFAAATLCFGLIKNHPFTGGNKRTATHLTDHFLKLNGFEIVAPASEVVEMVLAIESGLLESRRCDPVVACVHATT
jgi:death on curing protein